MTEMTNERKPYPRLRVALLYPLLGGAIGGFLLALVFDIRMLDLAVVYGAVIGFFPALLCGLWLAWRRAHRALYAALVGAVSSALCSAAFIILQGDARSDTLETVLFYATVGGASAFVLGLCILPPPPQDG